MVLIQVDTRYRLEGLGSLLSAAAAAAAALRCKLARADSVEVFVTARLPVAVALAGEAGARRAFVIAGVMRYSLSAATAGRGAMT